MTLDFLSTVFLLPAIGGVVVLLAPSDRRTLYRSVGMIFAILTFIFSIPIFIQFAPHKGFQFERNITWIKEWGVRYHIGVDGLSLLLVMLTTFLTPLVILGATTWVEKKEKEYISAFLIMETFLIGTFISLNLFLFYICWEGVLIPMYLLIGVWGGERRIYSAVKFFLYTLGGSFLMLAGIIYIYVKGFHQWGFYSFELFNFYQITLSSGEEFLLFLAFFVAFAIKVPIFPFHTWLPDAHTEAPTEGSVMLASVLLKMGTYGLIRFTLPLFPNAFHNVAPYIGILAIVSIIYGALVAMVQPDFKRLIAFSSVSHMGYVILGMITMNLQGLSGSVLQMVNHGLSTGALFFLVGMIYARRHTRMFSDFGGIGKVMPLYGALFLIVMLSSIGLPGTNGFVGEFLIIIGALRYDLILGVLCAGGVILSAAYMLWAYKRVFHGEITVEENKGLKDLNWIEISIILIIGIFIIWIGIYPWTFLSKIQPSVEHLIKVVEGTAKYGGF